MRQNVMSRCIKQDNVFTTRLSSCLVSSFDISPCALLDGFFTFSLAGDLNLLPKIISLIRSIRENNLNDIQIDNLEKSLNLNNNKALIIAAGLGSRLKKHTEKLLSNFILIKTLITNKRKKVLKRQQRHTKF